MEIFDEELYKKIMRGNKKIVAYYTYPVGTVADTYIAEDEVPMPDGWNESLHDNPINSDLVNAVDFLLNTAHRYMGRQHRDNKEAVKCEIDGIDEPYYFISYDSRRIIASSINTSRGSTEYPINQL